METRDIIIRLVKETIDSVRPRYRYATVQSLDMAANKATVIYNGEQNPVMVNMGSVQPRIGAAVRIEGIGTDKYIADVVGGGGGSSDSEVLNYMGVY